MNTKPLLAASLVMNALLLGAEAYLLKCDSGDLSTVPPLVICVGNHGFETAESALSPAPRREWLQIESKDYAQYVAHLRSLGCPGQTICDIVTADVNQMFRTRGSAQVYSANHFAP